MINEISRILVKFRPCFSRKAAFDWFVIVIVGFIVRLDHYGVSSFVRWLYIKPSLYTALLSVFRASSWQLQNVLKTWWQIVLSHCPPKVSVTSLMAAMAVELVTSVGKRCIIVLDAYFAVGPVFLISKQALDESGNRLLHIVTRAKNKKQCCRLQGSAS